MKYILLLLLLTDVCFTWCKLVCVCSVGYEFVYAVVMWY